MDNNLHNFSTWTKESTKKNWNIKEATASAVNGKDHLPDYIWDKMWHVSQKPKLALSNQTGQKGKPSMATVVTPL